MRPPKVAYILLWFPKPSETFIFREVINLWKMGLPLEVFTLYGRLQRWLSPEMASVSGEVTRLGIPFLPRAPQNLLHWFRKNPRTVLHLFRTIPVRPWRSFEVAGENLWAFFCGFYLARLFQERGIDHIHAPWANGPATAAWVASKLTGIPFSFMGRAVDIHPPDGALKEKIRDSLFVRTNPAVNVPYLRGFAQCDAHKAKIHLTYDGYPLRSFEDAPVCMVEPFHILSLGRFDRIKGFEDLLRAAGILMADGMDFHLTMAGAGPRGFFLKSLSRMLGLRPRVSFPGFVPYDRVSQLFCSADLFVMPSVIHRTGERDGIPNVILEAFLHRLPVVATDVAGIAEVVRDRETGFLVPPGNPPALAQAIRRMTRDRDASLAMAERGRALVFREFDPQRRHRELLQLFTDECCKD